MGTPVTLTSYELALGAFAGSMRQVENVKRGRRASYGAGHDNDWQLNIEGVLGEMALAKFLGIYWSGKGEFRGPDLGGEIEVRTNARDNGDLILHPKDLDDRPFWLLTGRSGSYVVRGWLLARDGKRPEYWRDPVGGRPAFFVPQSVLKPPTQLERAA
jgi:hypothetical protein